MTSRARAEEGVAAGDAVAGDAAAADDVMTSVTAPCRPVWMTTQRRIAGRLQLITTASMTGSMVSQVVRRTSPAKRSTAKSAAPLGSLTEMAAPTRKPPLAVGDVGGVGAAAVEAVVSVRVISIPGPVQRPRGASNRLNDPKAWLDQGASATLMPIGNSMTSRYRPDTVRVLRPGRRIRPAAREADRPRKRLRLSVASQRKLRKTVIGMAAKLVVVAVDDEAEVATGGARQGLLIPAARVRSPRDARPTAAVSGVADGAAGAPLTTAARRRLPHSTAAGGTNSPRWQAAARKMTTASSSSALRMPAAMAMFGTSGILPRVMTTASSRAGSTRCLTCRVGSRRSAS
jgi:hypothetical protein